MAALAGRRRAPVGGSEDFGRRPGVDVCMYLVQKYMFGSPRRVSRPPIPCSRGRVRQRPCVDRVGSVRWMVLGGSIQESSDRYFR